MRALAFAFSALAAISASAALAERVKGPRSYTTELQLNQAEVSLPEGPVWVSSFSSFATSHLDAQFYVQAEAEVIATDGTRLFEAGTVFASVPSDHEALACTMSLARPKGRVGNFCFADTNRDGLFEQGTGMSFIPGFETLHIPKTRFAIEPVRFVIVDKSDARSSYPLWLQVSKIDSNSASFDICLKPDVKDTLPTSVWITGFEPACLTGSKVVSLRELPVKFMIANVELEVKERRDSSVLVGFANNSSALHDTK